MEQIILIAMSRNETPEAEVQKRILSLTKEGFRIVLVSTSLAPHGETDMGLDGIHARDVYFATTVVLVKQDKPDK